MHAALRTTSRRVGGSLGTANRNRELLVDPRLCSFCSLSATRHDENSDPGKEPDREKSVGNRTNGVELSAFRIQPDQGEHCGWHRSPCYDQSLSTNAWPHAIFQTITGNHRIYQLGRVVSNNKQNLSTFVHLYIIRVINYSFDANFHLDVRRSRETSLKICIPNQQPAMMRHWIDSENFFHTEATFVPITAFRDDR